MTRFPDRFPFPLIHVAETHSTNSYLSDLCNRTSQPEFTTVVSDYQSSGRGQRGNSWESEAGKNLLFSFVLYPHFLPAHSQFMLSQITSLAIKEELGCYTEEVSIKWPNDIYWREKKLCGMLIENDLTGSHLSRSIVGVGININQQRFLSSAPNPVSLWQITKEEEEPLNILQGIIARVENDYRLLQEGQTACISSRYRKALFRGEGFHSYQDTNGKFMAEVIGTEPGGRLLLKDEEGNERGYMFKEVEFLLT